MPASNTPGPVVVVLQVHHPAPTSTVVPPATTVPGVVVTTVPAGSPRPGVRVATPATPVSHQGSLPLTGAPLAIEVTAGLALLLAGGMAALAARRRARAADD